MLLRLNISTQSGGTLLATLSQQEGFFPYRLDNFSSETLHVRYQPHARLQVAHVLPGVMPLLALLVAANGRAPDALVQADVQSRCARPSVHVSQRFCPA